MGAVSYKEREKVRIGKWGESEDGRTGESGKGGTGES